MNCSYTILGKTNFVALDFNILMDGYMRNRYKNNSKIMIMFFGYVGFVMHVFPLDSRVTSLKSKCMSVIKNCLITAPQLLLPVQENTESAIFTKIFQRLPTDLIEEICLDNREPLKALKDSYGVCTFSGPLIGINHYNESWRIESLQNPTSEPLVKDNFKVWKLYISPQQNYVIAHVDSGSMYAYKLKTAAIKHMIRLEKFSSEIFFDKNEKIIGIDPKSSLRLLSPEDKTNVKLLDNVWCIIAYLKNSHSILIETKNSRLLNRYYLATDELKVLDLKVCRIEATFSSEKKELLGQVNFTEKGCELDIINIDSSEKLTSITIPCEPCDICSACFDTDGNYIAVDTTSKYHSIYICDLTRSDSPIFSQKIYNESAIQKIIWEENELRLLDGYAQFYRINTRLIIKAYEYLKKCGN